MTMIIGGGTISFTPITMTSKFTQPKSNSGNSTLVFTHQPFPYFLSAYSYLLTASIPSTPAPQEQIQDFPGGVPTQKGSANPKGGHQPIIWPNLPKNYTTIGQGASKICPLLPFEVTKMVICARDNLTRSIAMTSKFA